MNTRTAAEIRVAIEREDGAALLAIVERLRLLGYRYQQCFELAHNLTGIDLAEFDALLEEGDQSDRG